jgi:hypothetical protein
MNDETFKKILYLILKVTIKNSGFLSQLEIFRDVRFFLNKYFGIKEGDLIVKIGQGKNEDFKDILNFILTILCELALVSQKMENKSFYFKWNGFKGFRKKYLLEIINNKVFNFEMSESFEHRVQIYTRMVLIHLFENKDTGITQDQLDEIMKNCGLENHVRHTDKIHSILKFIDFIIKEGNEKAEKNISNYQIFTLLPKENNLTTTRGDLIIFKLNKFLTDENFVKDINYSEKYYSIFNENILNKISLWTDEISKFNKGENDSINLNSLEREIKMNLDYEAINSMDYKEINEIDQYKVKVSNFNSENEEVGFALLRGTNWCYYIKKLYCIIGRAPIKYGPAINNLKLDKNNSIENINIPTYNYGDTTWQVDVDLGQNRKISKQHALIAYNFQTCSFEIQNLSKKHPIKVNGEAIKYGEEMPISSKSLISIGNQEFYFLLPL